MSPNRKLRVLFLHRHADEKGAGGVMEYLHYLPLFLKEQGIEVFLYREGDSRTLEGPAYFQNGMPVYEGPFLKPQLFSSWRKLSPLVELCKKEAIDLIHAQGTYRSGYLALQMHKTLGLPFVVTSHSDIIPTSSRMHKKKTLRYCRKILQAATAVTHLSPTMAELSHQIFSTTEKSNLIGNGVDLKDWLIYQTLPEQNYLLALGRLELEKGFHILIDAYARLREQGIKASLVIAGQGSAEGMLQARVKELGLPLVTEVSDFSALPEEAVIFPGYVCSQIKKQLIAQSKIILFSTQPSLWEEPFGIVQIEAMAAGKPLIASDSRTSRYLQGQGLHALLAQADSPFAWAEQIYHLLENSEKRKKMGKENQQNALQFDWSRIAKQYKKLYVGILEKFSLS